MHGGISRRRLTATGLSSLVAAGALAGGIVAGTAGASDHATPRAAQPITIGISLSLSGDFSADGQAFQRGYELWANDVNRAGGLLGRPVKLDIVSDASSPTQVVTNYQKLISIDHVSLLFGPFSTLLTVPASKIANRFGYALVEGAGGAPAVFANGLHNVFDVSLPVADNLVQFAKWIASMPASVRPKTAAYPTSNDPFTEPQLPPAEKILQAAGVKTVYSKVFPAEVTDYTPIADAVAASHAQVVVLGSVDVPTVSSFIQAFAQHGLVNRLLGGVGLAALERNWLGSPTDALAAVGVTFVYSLVGVNTLIFVTGMATIDPAIYEAGKLDGTSWLQSYVHLTLPMLRRYLVFTFVITTISAFSALFSLIYTMTGGGPNYGTTTIEFFIYQQAFGTGAFGVGALLGVVLFVILVSVSAVQVYLMRRSE